MSKKEDKRRYKELLLSHFDKERNIHEQIGLTRREIRVLNELQLQLLGIIIRLRPEEIQEVRKEVAKELQKSRRKH